MKTIKHISFKSLVLVALAALFTLPAKAQMTDNGYANIDWQYNFPINNAFTDRSSGWGMNFDGGYFLTENWAIGAFLSYHTNHEYVPRRTITSGSASLTTDQQHSTFQLPFGLETRFREEPDVEVLHVVADRHVVVLPRTHPLAEKALLRFSETLAYPYVSAPRSAPIGAAMAERAQALGIDYAPVAEMPSFALMLELVLQGAGLAIMPKAALRSRADALERLSVVDLVDEWADRPLAFAHLKNRPLTAAAHAFVRACATEWADG